MDQRKELVAVMIYLVSAGAALLPVFIALFIITRIDRYEEHFYRSIFKYFAWGAVGAISLTFIFGIFLRKLFVFFIEVNTQSIQPIFIAPLLEELMKGIFLFFNIRSRKFNTITSAMIFGGMIGLGFGTIENFLYFITYRVNLQEWLLIVIVRTTFSSVMHCIATSIFGAFLQFSKLKEGIVSVLFVLSGFILAVIVHSIWNLSVSFGGELYSGLLAMVIIVSVFIFVFSFSIFNEKKNFFIELAEESNKGIIPVEHLDILNSSRRNAPGWLDERIRKHYVNAALNLAFNKMKYKNSKGDAKYFYEDKIHNYRTLISEMNIKNNFISNE